MTKYEQYLEDYRKSHRVNMWNPEVVDDLAKEFNISHAEAHEIRLNWYNKYEKKRINI